jgi:hypothetical protein
MLVRTALGAVCASALVAGTLAPAAVAAQGGGNDELKLRVCKYVDNGDDFDIDVWTDEERKSRNFEDEECKTWYLDYDRARFWLEEDIDEDEWDVSYKITGDAYKAKRKGEGYIKVWFDDDEDDPYVKVRVYNEER